jgi:ComF family protein
MGAIRYKRLSKVGNLYPFGEDLLGLFYPRCCFECGRQLLADAELFCHICATEVPRCFFSDRPGNRLEELFYGRVRIEAGTSYFYFKKHGIVQKLLHALKYRARQDVGAWIGKGLAKEIQGSGRFASIDLVIPVPLHPKKKRIRGYNQVTRFAEVLADHLEVPLEENALKRVQKGKSLTGKSRIERIASMKDAFTVADTPAITGKHVLLADDVITSGATLEACAQKLLSVPGTRVSLVSMAFTL